MPDEPKDKLAEAESHLEEVKADVAGTDDPAAQEIIQQAEEHVDEAKIENAVSAGEDLADQFFGTSDEEDD